MSLGNILIRPQMLDRRPLSTEAEVMDLLTALASRLVEDFMRGGAASTQIVAACSEIMAAFIPQFKPRLETVGTKLEDWLKPYLDLVKSAPTPDTTVKGLLATADFGFKLVNTLLAEGHTKSLTKQLNGLLDIVETDLGITRKGLEKLFLDILDRMEAKLSSEFLNGNQNEDSLNNFLLSVQIRRARREIGHLLDRIPLPDINPRQLIRDMELRLEATGWDETLDKIQKQIPDIQKQITEGLPKLNKILKFDKTREMGLMRDIGVDGGQYAWYVSWFNGEPTKAVDRFSLAGSEEEQTIKFKHVSLEFLEHWTQISTVGIELFKTILNAGYTFNSNSILTPLLNTVGQASMTVFSFLSALIDDKTWADFMKIKENSWVKKILFPETLTLIGSRIEHFPDFKTWFWSFWQIDRANTKKPKIAGVIGVMDGVEVLNNAFLSICTLINYDKADIHAKNYQKIHGLTALSRKVSAFCIARVIGQGKFYHSVFDNPTRYLATNCLGAGLVWGANLTTWLLAGAITQQISGKYWEIKDFDEFAWGKNAYGAVIHSFIDFHNYFDLGGQTNGGKYGLKKIISNDKIEFQQVEFKGYAPRTTSPYLLPFEGSNAVFCSQTHRGKRSHNNYTGLIYAVDFVLKRGTVVLAMRGGTVVEYADHYKTGDGRLNYIVVEHDVLNIEHDKDELGQLTTTYACYENSEPFGIRRAFAAQGVPAKDIIGSRVQQGAPILFLDKRTDWDKFDCLKVFVSAASSEALLPTIPFVFKDIHDDGVPEKGKYYVSNNVTKPLSMSIYHPDKCEGIVQESGLDYAILEQNSSEEDGFYAGAHIFVSFDMPDGTTQYVYHMIKNYEGNTRKAVIEGNWLLGEQLPENAQYRIGSKKFSLNSEFDQQFAHAVERDSISGEIKKLGGTIPLAPMKKAIYHKSTVSGRITGGGKLGQREVYLDENASPLATDYRQQHIAIFRKGQLIQYQLIENYKIEAGVKKVVISGQWEIDLISTGEWDTYQIGEVLYTQSKANKNSAYLAPDRIQYLPTPTDFSDMAKPYAYAVRNK
jgi:hypothetical protein